MPQLTIDLRLPWSDEPLAHEVLHWRKSEWHTQLTCKYSSVKSTTELDSRTVVTKILILILIVAQCYILRRSKNCNVSKPGPRNFVHQERMHSNQLTLVY